MFYCITRRVTKQGSGLTGKFDPRTTNVHSWTLSGPFEKQSTAERFAVRAAGTHTCLAAQVASQEELEYMAKQHDTPYDLQNTIVKHLRTQDATFNPL